MLREPEGPGARHREAGVPGARESSRSSSEALAEGFDRDDALELLRAHGDDARVLVVGHEPDFSQVVLDLTGGAGGLQEGRRGGGARASAARGELLVLLRPRELESLAAGG